ncbi:AAA family ATPase [Mesobacillus selenatarsenatis]|uniref:DNA topology modulation protein n=1 Tax=Mesobacillus selenatarsenatis (strain DSM 18680 / JCM 14380 / FERM P-15431 / SF-1) TaxID=1321606 RepID=A0A0A8X9U3_MESS1|nr:AAA family ATPase [Mesobacillus selenatarsenatis]GAM16039.1 DNA topology modulation protein [Mesobacillus selenatarsenatis SF-1]
MTKIKPNKIHIIGSVGSGKTTLARSLSARFNLPHHELDNVVWKRTDMGDIRRSDRERDEYLKSIVNTDSWIIEGVHYEWVADSFENADMIIFLDLSYRKRKYRIIRRFILQKLGVEKANYAPTLKIFRKMFVWNRYFEEKSRQEILTILGVHQNKLCIIKEAIELEKNIFPEAMAWKS